MAPEGAVCDGCGKPLKFCPELCYGSYIRKESYKLINQFINTTTYEQLHREYVQNYNFMYVSVHFMDTAEHASQAKRRVPPACMYAGSYLKLMQAFKLKIAAHTREVVNNAKASYQKKVRNVQKKQKVSKYTWVCPPIHSVTDSCSE